MVAKQEKITIIIPSYLKDEITNLKKELKTSMNALYQEAIESYVKQKKREKIRKEAMEILEEYKTNPEIKELAQYQGDIIEY